MAGIYPGLRGQTVQGLLRSVVAIGLMAVALPAAAQKPELASATESLRLSIDEWRREDAAYRAARGAAKISAVDAQEYAGFVARLRLRVLEQCEAVRRLGGEEAISSFECIRVGPEERIAVIVAPATAQTEEEKRAALQARLDQLEGDIDDSLQKRQQDIRQKASPAGGRASSGTGTGGAKSGEAAGSRTSSAPPGSTWGPPPPEGGGKSGESERTATTGSTSSSTGLPTTGGRSAQRQTPADGGSDDDVVARQLREAVEKETDPVLKEKLWAEYRKYKEGKR
jgi:hypothetical protein